MVHFGGTTPIATKVNKHSQTVTMHIFMTSFQKNAFITKTLSNTKKKSEGGQNIITKEGRKGKKKISKN
jgi:hypothetical protein